MSQKQQPELVDGLIRAMDESLSEYNQLGAAEEIAAQLARLAAYESLGSVDELTEVISRANELGVKVTELVSELDAQQHRLAVAESLIEGEQSLEEAVESVLATRRHKRTGVLAAQFGLTREVVSQVMESVEAEKVEATLHSFKTQIDRTEQLNESVRLMAVKYNLPHEQVKGVLLSADESEVEGRLAEMAQAAARSRAPEPVQESNPSTKPTAEKAHDSVVRLADRI